MSTNLQVVKSELPSFQALISIRQPNQDAAVLAKQELEYLEMIAMNKPDIYNCDPRSIVLAVKDVLNKNLSLNPSAGLVYTMIRKVKVGSEWVSVLELRESANGKLSVARQQGRLLDFTYPEIKKNAEGKVVGVSMKILVPSYQQPRWQEYSFDESDFTRWQRASHKEFSRSYNAQYANGKPAPDAKTMNYANPNYTSWMGGIDPEFARAKCIVHATKKLGTNLSEGLAVMATSVQPIIDPKVAESAAADDYITYEETPMPDVQDVPVEVPKQPVKETKVQTLNFDDL